jgi:hypothetical protein
LHYREKYTESEKNCEKNLLEAHHIKVFRNVFSVTRRKNISCSERKHINFWEVLKNIEERRGIPIESV